MTGVQPCALPIWQRVDSGRHDALDILRWKEIVEAIEKAIDSVENAADVVSSIAVKHA